MRRQGFWKNGTEVYQEIPLDEAQAGRIASLIFQGPLLPGGGFSMASILHQSIIPISYQYKVSLKKMHYDALVEAGKIKDIATEKNMEMKRTFKITKRVTLSLSWKLLIEEYGFREGDKFTVLKRKDSGILKKQGVE